MSDDILPATEGAGPLLQRDYWAVFAECPLKPSEVIDRVTSRFCELPPPALVDFVPAADGALDQGCELDINIKPAQHCRVRVIHKDANSITLGTLVGHPEAGRITFGAYRNPNGEVIFHIRSRARSSTTGKRLGFLAIGDAMQTNTWTDFINNTAAMLDTPIKGVIHVEKEEVEEEEQDAEPLNEPTFFAKGD